MVQQKFEKEGAVIVRDFTIKFDGDEIEFQRCDSEKDFEIVAPYHPSVSNTSCCCISLSVIGSEKRVSLIGAPYDESFVCVIGLNTFKMSFEL